MSNKSKRYEIKKDMVLVPIDDAARIRYLLENLHSYVESVGPRELRGNQEETEEFILNLPKKK